MFKSVTTGCFTTIYWSLNYTTSTTKNLLMAYLFQKVGFMAYGNSNYLNERWGWSYDEPPCQKIPSISPPCHTKVTLLMAEFCDPASVISWLLVLRFVVDVLGCQSQLSMASYRTNLPACAEILRSKTLGGDETMMNSSDWKCGMCFRRNHLLRNHLLQVSLRRVE
jgi:hypothetical protein